MAASIETTVEAVPNVSNGINATKDMDDHGDTSTSSISEEFLNLTANSVNSNGNVDHSELNGHCETTEETNIQSIKLEKNKTDNVKLAATFNGSPIIVSEELNLSSSETELITKVVLNECDEVPIVTGRGSNSRSVEAVPVTPTTAVTEPPPSDTDLPESGMADSYIKSVDDVPLAESYIKISLTEEAQSLATIEPSASRENEALSASLENEAPASLENEAPTIAEPVAEVAAPISEPQKNETRAEEEEVVVQHEAVVPLPVAEAAITVADVPETSTEPGPEATNVATTAAEVLHVEADPVVDHETVEDEVNVPSVAAEITAENTTAAAEQEKEVVIPEVTKQDEDPSLPPVTEYSVDTKTTSVLEEMSESGVEQSNALPEIPSNESTPNDAKSPTEHVHEPVTESPPIVLDMVDDMTAPKKITDIVNTEPVQIEAISVETVVPEVDTKVETTVSPELTTPAVAEPETNASMADDTVSLESTSTVEQPSSSSVEKSGTLSDVPTTESALSDTKISTGTIDTSVIESSATAATVVDNTKASAKIEELAEPILLDSNSALVSETNIPEVEVSRASPHKPEKPQEPHESIPKDVSTPVETPEDERKTESVSVEGTDTAPVVKPEPEVVEPEVAPVVEEWLDILGNGLLKKKVLVKGKGETTRPKSRNAVTVRCEGKLKDETIVDKHEQLKFILSDQDVIQAFDLAVGLMEDGETALVFTDAKYAYGVHGKKDVNPPIPQNASITYEIEILSIAEGPDLKNLTDEERVQYGDQKRIRGNDFYALDDFNGAIDLYSRGIKYLDGSDNKSVMDMKIKCLNNLSAAQLKVRAYKSAITSLNTVLQFEPENVKALFRKGKCLDGMKKEAEALECIKKASALDPSNKQLRQEMERLKSVVNATKKKEAAMYQKMFNEKPLDKLVQEEEERSWMIKMMSGGVIVLGFIVGYLQWRR